MDSNQQIVTKNARETAEVGERLAASLKPSVLCLYGDLGSGKTTFTQGFAKGLGLQNRLLSPTFIIVRRYQIPVSGNFFYHIDLYRTKTTADMENLGFSEIIEDQDAYVLIEWAEKLENLLPKNRIDIHFKLNTDDSHTIIIGKPS
jgi:tRNA threonylcarbamoyladenosine biosynthesis protein TsaE